MLQPCRQGFRNQLVTAFFLLLLLGAAREAAAQSGDPGAPTPVFTNEISGRIAPRDVGDPRRTRHFYTFVGTGGDLTVTLESSDLVGDVDVFSETALRPLLKITLYGDAGSVSKSFFLRNAETLILRVEARAIGDNPGAYRLRFEGAFAPAPADTAQVPEAPTLSSTGPRGKGVRRVTSTGARVEEPAEAAPEEATKEKETKPAPTAKPAAKSAERTAPLASRKGRATRSASSRTRGGASKTRPDENAAPPETAEEKPTSDANPPAEAKPEGEAPAVTRPKPAARRRVPRAPRRGANGERAETKPPADASEPAKAAPPAPAPTQRLIIVTKDGETLERDMNTVRRVTVENNQVVIIGKDGKIIRQPLANVLRMSIEP
jgi:hypothetical protein